MKQDFSPLDPSTNGARWERMISNVVARALARPTVARQLRLWARPALAAAAALLLVSGGMLLAEVEGETGEPVEALAQLAAADQAPSSSQLQAILGAHNE